MATTGVPSGNKLLWSGESGISGGAPIVDRDGNVELLLPRCLAGVGMPKVACVQLLAEVPSVAQLLAGCLCTFG